MMGRQRAQEQLFYQFRLEYHVRPDHLFRQLTIYRCKFRLEGGGTRRGVRGFVGMSLFGRSQIWYREQ